VEEEPCKASHAMTRSITGILEWKTYITWKSENNSTFPFMILSNNLWNRGKSKLDEGGCTMINVSTGRRKIFIPRSGMFIIASVMLFMKASPCLCRYLYLLNYIIKSL